MNVNKEVAKALQENRFLEAKRNGKLTYAKPPVGSIAVFEDGTTGVTLRVPNSVGDFTVKVQGTGETVRTNIKSGNIKGYITQTSLC